MIDYIVENNDSDMRLDRFLSLKLKGITHSEIEKSIRKKLIKCNNVRTSASYRTIIGDMVSVKYIDQKYHDNKNNEQKKDVYNKDFVKQIIKSIIYKDDKIIAINKSCGDIVQGGIKSHDNKNERNISSILGALCFEYEDKPHIVHRLDKNTSGVFDISKNS